MNKKNEVTYTTLLDTGTAETTEKKSVFHAYAAHVNSEEAANNFISIIKKQNNDASHNVYAYQLANDYAKYSDDGEPQGTAGLPILQLIKTHNFTDAAIVVSRYFGGTLLGTGGLIRAYSYAAKKAIENAKIVTYTHFTEFKIVVSYSDYQKILPIIKIHNVKIDSSDFGENITLYLAAADNDFLNFSDNIEDVFAMKLKCEPIGSRFDLM